MSSSGWSAGGAGAECRVSQQTLQVGPWIAGVGTLTRGMGQNRGRLLAAIAAQPRSNGACRLRGDPDAVRDLAERRCRLYHDEFGCFRPPMRSVQGPGLAVTPDPQRRHTPRCDTPDARHGLRRQADDFRDLPVRPLRAAEQDPCHRGFSIGSGERHAVNGIRFHGENEGTLRVAVVEDGRYGLLPPQTGGLETMHAVDDATGLALHTDRRKRPHGLCK
jgi:hypothetical protein